MLKRGAGLMMDFNVDHGGDVDIGCLQFEHVSMFMFRLKGCRYRCMRLMSMLVGHRWLAVVDGACQTVLLILWDCLRCHLVLFTFSNLELLWSVLVLRDFGAVIVLMTLTGSVVYANVRRLRL